MNAMADKPQLFGTDGVRGVAGQFPLDRETIFKLGRALGIVLQKHVAARPLRVVLGEDTRESSAWISQTMAAGLRSSSVEVAYAGVITTPGVAFLTLRHGFAGGVMVSASHNPYQDNGIKLLSDSGMKLSESLELDIEASLAEFRAAIPDKATEAEIDPVPQLLDDYLEFLVGLFPSAPQFSKFRLVADCGNGSASRVAPRLLRRLGIEARILNSDADGQNINLECGSLHPNHMAEATRESAADLGVAFDGDADRAIFSTREGRIVDGDYVLYTVATFFQQRGILKGGAVVGTLMTNFGLELALGRHGINLKRTAVGDKYVLEEMRRSGINLGGEPSGHVIFSDISLAGDGIITLLQILRVLVESGKSFSEIVSPLRPFPQMIRNVRVRERRPLESIPEVNHAVSEFRREVGSRGRVVVRYSGTEPLARVMVEAEEAGLVERHAGVIAGAIESALGLAGS
ncbi:MAG TPA: phosphoglucosamine mutase [Terriglobia bacterium]|nr:phosphoglucosamine mutase [Terriglobia bacterium]